MSVRFRITVRFRTDSRYAPNFYPFVLQRLTIGMNIVTSSWKENIMDREIPQKIIRKKNRLKFIKTASAVIVLLAAFWGFRAVISPSLARNKIRIGVVERAPIYASVNATGTVIPKFEQIITSPISSRVEETFFAAGDPIKRGQKILKINTESIQLEYDRMLDELELLKNNRVRLEIKLDQDKINNQTEYEIKELQTRYIKSQLDKQQHLYDIGGSTKDDLEKARLNLNISQKELEQLHRKVEHFDASLSAEIKELDLKIEIQKKKLSDLNRKRNLADVTSEYDGVVTWINDDIGAAINPGDIIAKVADLESFKIEARISDIHTTRLEVGGKVSVKANERTLTGEIKSIDPAVDNGQIRFAVALDDDSNPVLRSNLRVDVAVLTEYKDNVLRVKNGNFYRGRFDQKVFVIDGDYAVRKSLEIGLTNIDYVELIGPVGPGDSVIITDMDDYKHMEKIKIDR